MIKMQFVSSFSFSLRRNQWALPAFLRPGTNEDNLKFSFLCNCSDFSWDFCSCKETNLRLSVAIPGRENANSAYSFLL